MQIESIYIDGFRNYGRAELGFSPGLNLIWGANAQGKSNLLEAICYLGLASSFRLAPDPELIRHEQEYFYLRGNIRRQDGPLLLEAAAGRGKKRKWKVDGEARLKLAEVVGLFHTVIFAPEDIWLVRSGPEQRRRYLNRQLAQAYRSYCRDQLLYSHILKQRNACLKACRGEERLLDREQLSLWDQQLAETGARVAACREAAVEQLAPRAAEIHAQLSGGEELSLQYANIAAGKSGGKSADEIREHFLSELERLRPNEIYRGMSLCGPHRDDLLIRLDGRPARDFASQGQQRTAALSLKLAELELARSIRGEYPVLLLDDVLSELDQNRSAQVLAYVADKGQTFISAVDGHLAAKVGKRFHICAGEVLED
ncbi:MAG: DNA replication/repair protein RecF [Bacillota bacterium]|nr:DNA replication/repair protein RecF [Bacillota bacterium]